MIRTSRVLDGGVVHLVGLPGCVVGSGTITLESPAGQITGPATGTGSFALSIAAAAGEEIRIRYNQSAPAAVRVPGMPPPGGPMPPGPIPGIAPITPTTAGRVEVRGQTGASPGGVMLGVNPTFGEVVTSLVETDQTFRFEIAATSGQGLRVYDDGGLLQNPWQLTVP
jgi:hypothetical protein